MFDRNLKVVQTGYSVARVIPRLAQRCRLTHVLEMVRAEFHILALKITKLIEITGETAFGPDF